MTIEQDIETIWEALFDWAETSLGNKIGRGFTQGPDDAEHMEQYDSICEAMARLQEHLEAH